VPGAQVPVLGLLKEKIKGVLKRLPKRAATADLAFRRSDVFIAGKSIRGGNSSVLALFGAHPDREDYPRHGFVRAAVWGNRVETQHDGCCANEHNISPACQTQVPLPYGHTTPELELQTSESAQPLTLNLITRKPWVRNRHQSVRRYTVILREWY